MIIKCFGRNTLNCYNVKSAEIQTFGYKVCSISWKKARSMVKAALLQGKSIEFTLQKGRFYAVIGCI